MKSVAIIGCGKRGNDKVGWAIGHAHADGWRSADPSIQILGVDPSAENLQAFGEKIGLSKEHLFNSTDALYAARTPDFVSVCTWPTLHAPQVIEAARRGVRGIVCEKPMALNALEIRSMLAACREKKTRLAIAHQRCFTPVFQLARDLIRDGAIGTGMVLEGRVQDDWDILSWTVHWFDLARFLFGSKPKSVLAGIDFAGGRRYGHAVENASNLFVEYVNGAQANFITGPASPEGYAIVIRGSKGLLRFGETGIKLYTEKGFSEVAPDPAVLAKFPGEFAALFRELIAAAGTDAPMLCDAEQCAASTELAYAAHESARTMRTISLPLETQFAPLEVVHHQSKPAFPEGKVVLIADEHFGFGGRDGIAQALAEMTGQSPVVVDASKELSESDVAGAGLVALYHTQAEASSGTKSVLEAWVKSGKPMLIIHAALGGWPTWDLYKKWCGRVWVWGEGGSEHPHEPSTLTRVAAFPSLTWSTSWLPKDEVFIKLGPTSEVEDLVTATIPQGTFPAAWRSRTYCNIGAWVPGHRGDLWRVPAMREGLAAVVQSLSR